MGDAADLGHDNPFANDEYAGALMLAVRTLVDSCILAWNVDQQATQTFALAALTGACPNHSEDELLAMAWEVGHVGVHFMRDGVLRYREGEELQPHPNLTEIDIHRQTAFITACGREDLNAAVNVVRTVGQDHRDNPMRLVAMATFVAEVFLAWVVNLADPRH